MTMCQFRMVYEWFMAIMTSNEFIRRLRDNLQPQCITREKLPLTLEADSTHYNCLFNQPHNKCGHTDYLVINGQPEWIRDYLHWNILQGLPRLKPWLSKLLRKSFHVEEKQRKKKWENFSRNEDYDIPQVWLFSCTFLGGEYIMTSTNIGQNNKIWGPDTEMDPIYMDSILSYQRNWSVLLDINEIRLPGSQAHCNINVNLKPNPLLSVLKKPLLSGSLKVVVF